ncbi:MAG: TOBE domain-containing protein [Albidovulum sp.]|nr:TOBE domain-containing protein [Albidovulum sp.]
MLGIRPENINTRRQGIPIGEARIRVVEPMGSETLLSTSVHDETFVFLDRDRQEFSVGDTRVLFAEPTDFHFFEKTSGERLA